MPSGSATIPVLQLETLNKLVSKIPANPNLYFAGKFAEQRAESDTIKWEIEYGTSGLTPFVAPGAPAPKIGVDGVGEGSAKAAYLKEATFFDEVFLNNLREPGTTATYMTAERQLSRQMRKMRNRVDRRREWMMAKALINGGFSYTVYGGSKVSVSYGVPDTHLVSLTSSYYWDTGASKAILSDILSGKQVLADDAGLQAGNIKAMCNSSLLKLLMLDDDIQDLLKKSNFGSGDLFARPSQVIGSLIGVGELVVYDEFSESEVGLTAAVTGGSTTTIYVTNTADINVGDTARFFDVSEANSWEDGVITAVSHSAGTFTVSSAPTASFKANEDKVRIRTKFMPDNKFALFSERDANNEPVADWMLAPFGLGRNYGTFVDTKAQFDPEGLTVRIQNKSLPVVYHPDCSYVLTVKA